MTQNNQERLEKILWNYLMTCLDIHHSVEDREVRTIPDAQKKYASAILSAIELDVGEIEKVCSDILHFYVPCECPSAKELSEAIASAKDKIVRIK